MSKAAAARSGGTARPNLFIVGAPKCGTTAWSAYLKTHPDIYFSDVKEPTYFAFDMPRLRLIPAITDYEALFAPGREAKVRGEASAIYLYSAAAAHAIREYNPDARILVFLRPQETFLPSYHHQLLYRFSESIEDFETAWRLSGDRPADTIPKTCLEPRLLDYAAAGNFREQVERYLAHFPPEQVRVIDFESWTSNPRSTYLEIMDFLGLDDDGRTEFPPVNEAKSYRIKWLGRLIARPPRAVQALVNALKKVTGRQALRLGERASSLIATPGYRTSTSPELREEIRRYYEDDNRLLRQMLAGNR